MFLLVVHHMKNFIPKFRPRVCRQCVNEAFALHPHIRTADCLYHYYPQECPRCGRTKNIVIGYTLLGKLKMLLAVRR